MFLKNENLSFLSYLIFLATFHFQQQEMLLEWIDPRYLLPDITDDIQKEFEENSEIQLNDFLKVKFSYHCLMFWSV